MKLLFAAGLCCSIGSVLACGADHALQDVVAIDSASVAVEERCEPELLNEDAALPTWMTVAGGYAYAIDERSRELSRYALVGGVREHVADGIGSGWASLASDLEYLYTADTSGLIHRISLDGAEDVLLADTGDERIAAAIRVSGPYVYWHSSTGGPVTANFEAQVRRVSKDGVGRAEVLWTSSPGTYSSGLAIGAGYLFVDSFNWQYPKELQADGQILRISESGEQPIPLVTGLLVPRVHAADDRYVYFSAQTQNADRYTELWRVAVEGGPAELIQPGTSEISVDVGQMVVEGDTVWWGQANQHGSRHDLILYRATAVAGASALVTMQAGHMLGLAADDRNVYFSTSDGYDADTLGPTGIWRVGRQCSLD